MVSKLRSAIEPGHESKIDNRSNSENYCQDKPFHVLIRSTRLMNGGDYEIREKVQILALSTCNSLVSTVKTASEKTAH